MAGNILNTASTILCPHGGQATLITANTAVFADGSAVLLASDTHPVAGCPFMAGSKYSPCLRIEWSAGAGSVTVGNNAVLLQSSIGRCLNGEGATQGVAVIATTQIKGSAR